MFFQKVAILTLCLAVILGAGFLALASLNVGSMHHANEKHIEATGVRAQVRNGLCQQKEIWFKPAAGKVLLLCQSEAEPSQWGGWIVYATQNRGKQLLPELHEATVFVSTEAYWRKVIKRDGYRRGILYPRVVDHVTDSLGIP